MTYGIRLHVAGPFACFTRPETKVERFSYDVITPSAARGILEAIHWKPAIRWVIDEIAVLKPIRFRSIRRNEVGSKASAANAKKAMNRGDIGGLGIRVDEDRQQRASTVLVDVAYVISAHFEMTAKAGAQDNEGKHLDMFNRRARIGQCFHQPCLGTREFPARFTLIEDDATFPVSTLTEDQKNRTLGWMLHDIRYLPATAADKDSFLTGQGKRVRTEPRFFNADMKNGIIEVPPFDQAKA